MTQSSRPSRRRRLTVWAVAILLLMLIGSVTTVEVTSRSGFCNRCHIMKEFYTSWENDTHHDVQCVECHIAPGLDNFVRAKLNGFGQVVDDLLNRTSLKPSASVSDFSCMSSGCHDPDTLGEGDPAGRPYLFDHTVHLGAVHRGITVRCTTCHSHVKGSRHFEVNTNTCVTCHLIDTDPAQSPPATCRTCHEPPAQPMAHDGLVIDHQEFLKFGAACASCHRRATASSKPVDDASCLMCHPFGADPAASSDQVHELHAEGRHKIECFHCHGVTPHGLSAPVMSLTAFDCRSCHAAQHTEQRSAYLREDHVAGSRPAAVSPMFLAHVDCGGCHIRSAADSSLPGNGATVARAAPDACDRCHEPGFGALMIPTWQRSTRKLYDETTAFLSSPDVRSAEVGPEAALVTEARALLELVRLDGSWGVHNPTYTQQLLERARQLLVDAVSDREEATP